MSNSSTPHLSDLAKYLRDHFNNIISKLNEKILNLTVTDNNFTDYYKDAIDNTPQLIDQKIQDNNQSLLIDLGTF